MSRRSRRRPSPLTGGRDFPLTSPHRAAPPDFFPHDLLEDAERRARVWSDLSPRTSLRTVYQEGPQKWRVTYPHSPAKPRVARLSVFGGNAPSLFVGLKLDRRVLECVRRKQRRESLFAFRKVGFKGSSPGRRSKFNNQFYQRRYTSNYSCR